MSRARTRPTRDETRDRLFEAAGRLFEEQGIHATSIEVIAEEAGFTRGAFYSNFASKEDLVVAMIEDHVEQSVARNLALLAEHHDPAGFVAALEDVDRDRQDALGRSPLLHMELILFAARSERQRPELGKRLRARRAIIEEIVATTHTSAGQPLVDAAWAGALILAIEDGFRLHRLIDPESTPADSFFRALHDLQAAFGGV